MGSPPDALRVGFVTGATPDKWAGVWRERYPRERLELVPVTEAEQEALLRDGTIVGDLASQCNGRGHRHGECHRAE